MVKVPKGKADQRFIDVVGMLETDLNNAFRDFVTRLVEHGWSETEAKSVIKEIVETAEFEF